MSVIAPHSHCHNSCPYIVFTVYQLPRPYVIANCRLLYFEQIEPHFLYYFYNIICGVFFVRLLYQLYVRRFVCFFAGNESYLTFCNCLSSVHSVHSYVFNRYVGTKYDVLYLLVLLFSPLYVYLCCLPLS